MKDVSYSKKAKNIKLGIYEHYKKKKYQVLGVALHSETLEELVVYKALYGQGLIWVRPLKMFTGKVKVKGIVKPHFKLIK